MGTEHVCGGRMTRRGAMRLGAAAGGAALLGGRFSFAAEAAAGKTDVWVFHGTDKAKLMQAALKQILDAGGFGKDVKKLTLKVNSAWWRTPEEGANTHPELVDAFLKGVKAQGVKEIVMPEYPVDAAAKTFEKSGLLAVAKANNVPMLDIKSDKSAWKAVELPAGKVVQKTEVCKHFLETDCLVNMPVAKHHGGAGLTICMKNWMGAALDRQSWHRRGLHQCIADISTLLKPAWAIVDATRIMLDKGPKGPGPLKETNLLIVSRDQVAADIYAATLFPQATAARAQHLKIAAEMKLGTTDPGQMNIHKVEVA